MIPDANAERTLLVWPRQAVLTAAARMKKPSSKRAYPVMELAAIIPGKPSAWIPRYGTPSYAYCKNATDTGMETSRGIPLQASGSREKATWSGSRNWLPALSAFAKPEMKTVAE